MCSGPKNLRVEATMPEAFNTLPQLFHALSVVSFYIVTRVILPVVAIGVFIWYRYKVLFAVLQAVSAFARIIDRIIFTPIDQLLGIIGRIGQGRKNKMNNAQKIWYGAMATWVITAIAAIRIGPAAMANSAVFGGLMLTALALGLFASSLFPANKIQ